MTNFDTGGAGVQVAGGATCDMETQAGYTPLHVAAHFGQVDWRRRQSSSSVLRFK